jgi:uncharacterized membrane-anchored protein YhcB (DUF1043 family)
MWLLHTLSPDHNTISNFRRDNAKAIKKVFRETVRIAKHFNLIGGKLIAGDSTKFRAQNSKKNNYNQKKVERHLAYIEKKLSEYNQILSENDGDKAEVLKAIEKQQEHKSKYEQIQKELEDSGEAQLSTSDMDSRQMIIRNNITEVAYNTQTSVDSEYNLLIDYKTTNNNDSKAMGNMLRRAKSILGTNDFTALYDKGYHTGSELRIAQDIGIETIVAVPALSSASHAPNPAYNVSEFTYNEKQHNYVCPQGHILRTNGKWYVKSYRKHNTRIQQFKTPNCKNCPVLNQCTKNTRGRGRVIERSEYIPYIEKNKRNIKTKQMLYKRRQAIVEHPYGTIKRQWGFSYILTKQGIERAESDVGLICIAYNLRRIMKILDTEMLKNYLRIVFSAFVRVFEHIRMHKLKNKASNFSLKIIQLNFENSLNRLRFEQKLENNGAF